MSLRISAGERLLIGPNDSKNGAEIELEAGAHLDLLRINLADTEPRQEKWRVVFTGERASCDLNFLDLAKGSGKVTTEIEVVHQVPNCKSVQLHKGIYADKSHGIMKSNIVVPKHAVGTDAAQLHRSLLLCCEARIQAEPHLLIDTDDLKARHGASIGQLDEKALFYLRARGLSEEMARKMLVQAFAAEVLEKITVQQEQEQWKEQVFAWI